MHANGLPDKHLKVSGYFEILFWRSKQGQTFFQVK